MQNLELKLDNIPESYKNYGFAMIKGALSEQEVQEIRNETKRIYAQEPRNDRFDNPNIRTNPLERYPGLRKVFKNGKILKGLKSALGEDCVLVPDIAIHDSCLMGSWHKDSGGLDREGHSFQNNPDFHVVNVAFYMQDNHEEYAGGLDVVPGSHNILATDWEKFKANNRKFKFVVSKLKKLKILPKDIFQTRKGSFKIPSKAGDVLFFNIRLDHKPSYPETLPVPESHRKLALFMIFSKNNEYATKYFKHLASMAPLWNSYKYPEEYVKEMNSYGINLMKLPE